MKILWVDLVSELGGAQNSLLDICRHFLPGKDLEIVAAVPKGPLFDRLREAGITVYPVAPLRASRRGWRFFVTAAKLLTAPATFSQIIRIVKPDIIHANGLSAFLAVRHAAKKIPVLWHVRDLRQPIPIMREASHDATRIIPVSQAVAEYLAETLSQRVFSRITLIENGIDTERFRPGDSVEARKRFGLPQDVPLIGMIAHFIPWKRHGEFLSAAAVLRLRFPDAHFVLVGRDLFRENTRHIQSLRLQAEESGLSPFLHMVTDCESAEKILPAFTVLVHPAIGEPFGRVICEAMACGIPVVAVSSAGPDEIINSEENGLLCKKGEPEELAKAVSRLLDDAALREKFALQGRKNVCERFSIDRVCEQLATTYHSTLNALLQDEKRARSSDK